MGYLKNLALSLVGKRDVVEVGSKEFYELFVRGDISTITADNAMKVSTVFACVRLLSETIATLPLNLLQEKNGKRRHASEHQLYQLLKYKPNKDMNAVQLKEALMSSMTLRGNGYLQKVTTRGGSIVELPFLDASRMNIQSNSDGTYYYIYTKKSGKQIKFLPDEIINIPYFSLDGVTGLTPIELCRQGIGLALTAENHAKMFYDNGGKPNIALEIPQTLSSEAFERLKKSFNENYSGKNSYKTALLEGGAKINTLTMSAKDAEFIATRKFQKSEIATMFNVPAHMVGDLEKATFSNIEQLSINFEKFTIRPLATKIEAVLNESLLNESERNQGYYFKFNTDALLRGDIKTRYDAYAVARQWGWMSANDVRELEDLEGIKNGDMYLVPLNMTDASKINEVIDGKTTN